MKNKGYITIVLLFIGIYAISRTKKKKGRIIIDPTTSQKAFSKIGTTAYKEDLITPIYTFKSEILLGVLDYNEQTNFSKVQFTVNNTVKIGWIENNDIKLK